MAFFRRGGKGRKGGDGEGREPDVTADGRTAGDETSPQRVGVVSGVLSAPPDSGETPFGDVVARRFGPSAGDRVDDDASSRDTEPSRDDLAGDVSGEVAGAGDAGVPSSRRQGLRVVEPLFPEGLPEHSDPSGRGPALEVDPMAIIGRATTITGNIVAEEDLEIQGTVEGAVRLANHQVTIGAEGHVKASIDAEIVIVYGRVTGDVVASDLVEIEKGGIIGGDVKAPRIVMHDGAIVVGRLDMSASLPNGSGQLELPPPTTPAASEASHLTPVVSRVYDVEASPTPDDDAER